jgi:hypothetical protein
VEAEKELFTMIVGRLLKLNGEILGSDGENVE